MTLFAFQHVGQRKTYKLSLADNAGAEHPVAGSPQWEITAHLGRAGEPSVRPLAAITPSADGHSAVLHTFAWPGQVEIEVSAAALHPAPADPHAPHRSTTLKKRIVVTIPEIPPLAASLALRVVPAEI